MSKMKKVGVHPSLKLLLLVSGVFVLVLTSCFRKKEVIPFVENYVHPDVKAKFYFGVGSQWIYSNGNGELDTVTMLIHHLDTQHYYDDDVFIGVQEYFYNRYYSSFLDYEYTISRSQVAVENAKVGVIIANSPEGANLVYQFPNEVGVTYRGLSGSVDELVLSKRITTMLDGVEYSGDELLIKNFAALGMKECEVVLLNGIGIYSIKEIDSGRHWELVDYAIKK